MLDANTMTPDQLRHLADEKECEQNKPIKTGILKEDLYCCNVRNIDIPIMYNLYTKKQIEDILKKINNSFELAIKKGSTFTCFKDHRREIWCDDVNWGIEQDITWAKKYLKSIKNV